MSRKPHFLRQLSVVAFIASALLMPDKGLSQVLSTADAENNNYVLSTQHSDATNSEYGQKVVRNNSKQSVILTRLNTGGCRFVLLDKGQQMMKYVDIPTEYLINDFDLLKDTIYFGGRHYVTGDTLSKGFIGYISVPDLFFTPQVQCTYTDIPSLTNVQRVIAYNDSTNESIVAAMASQYYADVYYEPEPLHEFDSTINGPNIAPARPQLPIQNGGRRRQYRIPEQYVRRFGNGLAKRHIMALGLLCRSQDKERSNRHNPQIRHLET